MNYSTRKGRALGLCSGGLDSILSALLLQRQEIDVQWISFETPFFSSQRARQAAAITGIPLIVRDITTPFVLMLQNPPCGYGQHMNPCMDCHALMFRIAGEEMKKNGFDFLFSGEVLGQRPMSQTRTSLRYVEKNSGLDGLILRPLSAKKLPETIPEKQGLVDRKLLLGLSGRSRKPQLAMAKEFGISDYPTPAGGCLLTDRGFSNRLKDLFEHHATFNKSDLYLLRYGRHVRLNPCVKVIVGRTQKDNEQIIRLYDPNRDTIIKVKNYAGPTVLVPGGGNMEWITLAARICAGYSKAPIDKSVDAVVVSSKERYVLSSVPLVPSEIQNLLI